MGRQAKIKQERRQNIEQNIEEVQPDEEVQHEYQHLTEQGIMLALQLLHEQKFHYFALKDFTIDKNIVLEAAQKNYFVELYRLNTTPSDVPFQIARKELFNAVCWLIISQSSISNREGMVNQGAKLINDAAKKLYQATVGSDGLEAAFNPLDEEFVFWAFFPERWQEILRQPLETIFYQRQLRKKRFSS